MRSFFTLTLLLSFCISLEAQWTQKASMPSTVRVGAPAFSIGSKGYVGCGSDISTGAVFNDFWEWDQGSNTWTQLASFPGTMALLGAGWSINGLGYFASGSNASYAPVAELWEYNPGTNTWTQKANCPSGGYSYTVGWAIGNFGYICTGQDVGGMWSTDLWEWSQSTNTWAQKANLPGPPRVLSTGFAIGTNGYVGTGLDQNYLTMNDFWEWNQGTNTWTQKANLPGSNRHESNGFGLGGLGYIGTGDYDYMATLQDFQSFDPTTNTWTTLPTFNGPARELPTMFTIGCSGYVFGGWDEQSFTTNNVFNDLWEMNAGGPTPSIAATNDTVCAGSPTTITASGGTTYSWNTGATTSAITVTPSTNTSYTVYVGNGGPCTATAVMNILVSQPPVALLTGTDTVCPGNTATLTASGGTGYSWNTGATTSVINVIPTATTTYTVLVSSGTCPPDTASKTVYVRPGGPLNVGVSDVEICEGSDITLSAGISGGAPGFTYIWTTIAGTDTVQSPNSPTTQLTPTGNGTYVLVVTDACGLSGGDTVSVTIKKCEITIPNVITPNGDGYNNYFVIKNLDDFPGSHLEIYNRWGSKVYDNSDYRNDWAGEGHSDGTYYYVLHVSDGRDYAGFLTVLASKN